MGFLHIDTFKIESQHHPSVPGLYLMEFGGLVLVLLVQTLIYLSPYNTGMHSAMISCTSFKSRRG